MRIIRTNKYIKSAIILILALTINSCDKVEETEIGGTLTEKMAGDWYVETYLGESLEVGYELISTYNTAANQGNEMWIDDHEHIWTFKAKTPINLDTKTFAGSNLSSIVDDYQITLNITNGRITDNVKSSGGNPTLGISFDIEFSDDPGNVYTIIGYKRTGFGEDEH